MLALGRIFEGSISMWAQGERTVATVRVTCPQLHRRHSSMTINEELSQYVALMHVSHYKHSLGDIWCAQTSPICEHRPSPRNSPSARWPKSRMRVPRARCMSSSRCRIYSRLGRRTSVHAPSRTFPIVYLFPNAGWGIVRPGCRKSMLT